MQRLAASGNEDLRGAGDDVVAEAGEVGPVLKGARRPDGDCDRREWKSVRRRRVQLHDSKDHAVSRGHHVRGISGRERQRGYLVTEFHFAGGYTLIMSRWIPALVLALVVPLHAEGQVLKKRGEAPPAQKDGLPPEEDASIATKEYAFNPLQAKKEITTGNYYFKKGS